MVETRTPLELGIAVARMYLEQEFGYGNVEFMYKPDAEDKRRGTCSFWIENEGRQRIYFATKVLEEKRDPQKSPPEPSRLGIGGLHQECRVCACDDDDRGAPNDWCGMNVSARYVVRFSSLNKRSRKRYMSRMREIVEMPWVLLSCGFWMVLAFIRGQKIRYHQWRTERLEAQTRRLEAEHDRYERRARDLERRMSGGK